MQLHPNPIALSGLIGLVALLHSIAQAQSANAVEPRIYHAPSDPITESGEARVVVLPGPNYFAAAQSLIPTLAYDHGDPTPEEQLMLEIINRARANPPAEGVRLATTTDPDITGAYKFFGITTGDLTNAFAGYPARPPLAFNAQLLQAARGHSQDMAANSFQDHTGSDGSSLRSRTEGAGYTGWSNLGENVFAFGESVFYTHAAFNVDWGVPSLGHRRNVMNDVAPVFNEVGLGIVPESNPATDIGPLVVTQDFGLRTDRTFLVGVVFGDNDGDAFYNAGEGTSGVTVMPSSGQFFAVTSTSGGFAIPLSSASGSISVTISGGGVGQPIIKSVSLTGENRKLDFDLSRDPAAPPLRLVGLNPTGTGFGVTGPAGQRVVIQASNDLVQWLDLATNTLAGGAFDFVDGQAGGLTRRFYRAKLDPQP